MGPARQICHVVKLFHSDSCRRKSSAHFSMMSFLGMFVECGEKNQCHKPPILDTWYNPSKMVINVRTWGWLMFMALGKHHISWKAPVFRQFFFVFSQGVVFREHPMIRWAPKKKTDPSWNCFNLHKKTHVCSRKTLTRCFLPGGTLRSQP